MKNYMRISIWVAILVLAFGQKLQASKPALTKKTFPIGIWYDGRVEGINCEKGFVNVPFGLDKARAYYEKTFKLSSQWRLEMGSNGIKQTKSH